MALQLTELSELTGSIVCLPYSAGGRGSEVVSWKRDETGSVGPRASRTCETGFFAGIVNFVSSLFLAFASFS